MFTSRCESLGLWEFRMETTFPRNGSPGSAGVARVSAPSKPPSPVLAITEGSLGPSSAPLSAKPISVAKGSHGSALNALPWPFSLAPGSSSDPYPFPDSLPQGPQPSLAFPFSKSHCISESDRFYLLCYVRRKIKFTSSGVSVLRNPDNWRRKVQLFLAITPPAVDSLVWNQRSPEGACGCDLAADTPGTPGTLRNNALLSGTLSSLLCLGASREHRAHSEHCTAAWQREAVLLAQAHGCQAPLRVPSSRAWCPATRPPLSVDMWSQLRIKCKLMPSPVLFLCALYILPTGLGRNGSYIYLSPRPPLFQLPMFNVCLVGILCKGWGDEFMFTFSANHLRSTPAVGSQEQTKTSFSRKAFS